MGVDVVGEKTEVGRGVSGGAEDHGEVSGCEGGTAGATGVGAQWRGCRATRPTEVDAPTGEGVDGAGGGVTAAGMANDLAPFAILLVVEGKGNMCGAVQVGVGRRDGV